MIYDLQLFGQDVFRYYGTPFELPTYIVTVRCEANLGKYIPYTESLRYKVVYLVSSFVIPCLPLIFGVYIHPKLDTAGSKNTNGKNMEFVRA